MTLLVDVVIAVHDTSRPIARAVRSVFAAASVASVASAGQSGRISTRVRAAASVGSGWMESPTASVHASQRRCPRGLDATKLRLTVVCHNISQNIIREALGDELATRVRLIELADGVRSPAGPFNAGLDAAEARFVSIMGSDDTLEPGALAAWADFAERYRLDVVIPVQRHANGTLVRTPPVRPGRWVGLRPGRDRLVYRTAPLGLIDLSLVRRRGLRMTEGVATGEDQEFSARLWFSGAAIAYARGLPAYVVGEDAERRTTLVRRGVAAEFDASLRLITRAWFTALPVDARQAIAVKLVRVHVFSFLDRRCSAGDWKRDEKRELRGVVARIGRAAPGFADHLSRADNATLAALADPYTSDAQLSALVAARRRFGTLPTVLTPRWSALLAADSPARFMVASALL